MYCNKCGVELLAGSRFCTECGTIQIGNQTSTPPHERYSPKEYTSAPLHERYTPQDYAPPSPLERQSPREYTSPSARDWHTPKEYASPSTYERHTPKEYASPLPLDRHTPKEYIPSSTHERQVPQEYAASPPPRESYIPQQQSYSPPLQHTPPPEQHTPSPEQYTPPSPPPRQFQYAPPPRGYASAPKKHGMSPALKILSAVGAFVVVLILIGIIGYSVRVDPEAVTAGDINAQAENIGHNEGPAPYTYIATTPAEMDVLSGAQIFANNRDAVLIIRGICEDGYNWTGSGFIVSSSGVAVTNHHVMDGLVSSVAILYDGREFDITGYYSYDIGNDLAVIHVDGRGTSFDYVAFGNSYDARVGDNVFAIGGPDWDPLTFTPGMISRIAYEPVNFSIYSIAGMFQSTAAIYGGNSGGPLLNDRGQVIGVNAAGHTVRASVQFAVPINRVILPGPGAAVNPLPVGGGMSWPHHMPGEGVTYARFPFIPDFMSVSRHGAFSMSGTPADLGLSSGDVLYDYYEYLFIYDMPERHWINDTDAFDAELTRSGFIFQNVVDFGNDIWVYFFHPSQYVSLSYAFLLDSDLLVIAIAGGDVYERFYGGEPSPISDDVDFTGHPLVAGSWAWDTDSSYIYIFRPDGTGTRGFAGARHEIYWYAQDNYLFIDPGGLGVEEWTFTIYDGVLTIVSNQVAGITWNYIWQP